MKSLPHLKSICTQLIATAILAVGMGQSYAAVTIPNTFSAGTPAVAAQVNDNFTAVGNQMPAVKQAPAYDWVLMTAASGNLESITITPPGNGFVIVTATGTAIYTYTTGTSAEICLDLGTVTGDTSGCSPSGSPAQNVAFRSFLPSTFPSSDSFGYSASYSLVNVFPVTAGVAQSYYLNGFSSGTTSQYLFHPSLTVLFVPNALP